VAAGGLTVVAALQVWRINRSPQRELEADEAGIRIATRRGYTEMEAAKNLYTGIERLAQLEGRGQLDFAQLMRCQNLKTIAGLSRIGIPDR
jgi:predicted Zn-dependent protease